MDPTTQLVFQLKSADEDLEWYPTTDKMIAAVMRWLPEDANSIMDIGAGDGRVLEKFAEKCKDAKLYGIEKSQILLNAQPDCVIPVGTDVFEQNLSCLHVDYIFCNPPYSNFDEWMCKIIDQGYAKKAFLVVPQRWKDSKLIENSLKLRGATAKVIHSDDFFGGERPARAVIDIVEISFPREKWGDAVTDPFEIWFDHNVDTFDKAEKFKECKTGEDLARKYSSYSIDDMVAEYVEEQNLLVSNYRAIFGLDYEILRELGVNKDNVRSGLKMKMAGLKVKYWKILFDRLDAITSRLTTKSKGYLFDKLNRNVSVEFTASNAYSIVIWAIKNVNLYFDEQLIDLFHQLSTFEGVMLYKSNQKAWGKDQWRYHTPYEFRQGKILSSYALDYRIVVTSTGGIYHKKEDWLSSNMFKNNLHEKSHALIADVIAVMSNLGFSTNSASSLDRQWEGGKWQDFYCTNSDDILFQAKAYMNGNFHFRFMPAAIKALNVNAGRLLKWLRTEEDVVTELGYTPAEVKQYFHCNTHILPSGVKLLGAPS